jgi:hypothetical protein
VAHASRLVLARYPSARRFSVLRRSRISGCRFESCGMRLRAPDPAGYMEGPQFRWE